MLSFVSDKRLSPLDKKWIRKKCVSYTFEEDSMIVLSVIFNQRKYKPEAQRSEFSRQMIVQFYSLTEH